MRPGQFGWGRIGAPRRLSAARHVGPHDRHAKTTPPAAGRIAVDLRAKVGLAAVPRADRTQLADVVRVERMGALPADAIASVWSAHFEEKAGHTSLVLAEGPFAAWAVHRSAQSPVFVIPLQMGSDVCNFMVQHEKRADGACVAVFTKLQDYQERQAAAPIRLAAHCFGDFLGERGVGLVKAQFDGDLLSRAQATALLSSCVEMYTSEYEWVRLFNAEAASFHYDSFLAFFQRRFWSRE